MVLALDLTFEYMSILRSRYGDASWERLEDLLQFYAMGQSFYEMRPGFYDAFMGRNSVSGNHNLFRSGLLNSNPRSSSCPANELQREILQPLPRKESLEGHEFKSSKLMQSQVQELSSSNKSNSLERGGSSTTRLEKQAGVKRKTENCYIPLSLSLGLSVGQSSGGCQEQEGLDDEEDHSQLSLSLWSSRCSSKQRRLMGDSSSENGRGASTLDLTL